KNAEINPGRAANRGSIEHRMIRNDVVTNPGMDRQRDAAAKGLGENGGGLPRMRDFVAARLQAIFANCNKEFCQGRGERVGWKFSQRLFKLFGVWNCRAFFLN